MADEYDRNWRYTVERQHSVRNPIIINEDIDIQRRMFWEAALSTGVTVDFYNCCYDKSDFYQDSNLKWKDAIYLPIIFDDAPKIKVLKDYGWFTEDDERPELAYLPMYEDWMTKKLLDLRDNSLIRVHYFGQNSSAEFRITDKKMDSIYGVYWICKLAPERLNDFYLVDIKGEHFLKRNYDRNGVCEHSNYNNEHGMDEDYDAREYNHERYTDNITRSNNADDYYDIIMNVDSENTVDSYKENINVDKINETDSEIDPSHIVTEDRGLVTRDSIYNEKWYDTDGNYSKEGTVDSTKTRYDEGTAHDLKWHEMNGDLSEDLRTSSLKQNEAYPKKQEKITGNSGNNKNKRAWNNGFFTEDVDDKVKNKTVKNKSEKPLKTPSATKSDTEESNTKKKNTPFNLPKIGRINNE